MAVEGGEEIIGRDRVLRQMNEGLVEHHPGEGVCHLGGGGGIGLGAE